MNLSVAVPAGVNCALPIIAASSHKAAEASQKVMDPVVNGEPPPVTEAVNVTAAGEATIDCGESVRVVTVDTAASPVAGNTKATVSRAARARLGLRR